MVFFYRTPLQGDEYDAIQLVNDFITEEKLEKLLTEQKEEDINKSKINEEINLLYVAVTRTKNSIHIPEDIDAERFSKKLPNSCDEG